jgi:hypothetical protein
METDPVSENLRFEAFTAVTEECYVRFEVFMAVTMKNAI